VSGRTKFVIPLSRNYPLKTVLLASIEPNYFIVSIGHRQLRGLFRAIEGNNCYNECTMNVLGVLYCSLVVYCTSSIFFPLYSPYYSTYCISTSTEHTVIRKREKSAEIAETHSTRLTRLDSTQLQIRAILVLVCNKRESNQRKRQN
jgi:hypothetical protein